MLNITAGTIDNKGDGNQNDGKSIMYWGVDKYATKKLCQFSLLL